MHIFGWSSRGWHVLHFSLWLVAVEAKIHCALHMLIKIKEIRAQNQSLICIDCNIFRLTVHFSSRWLPTAFSLPYHLFNYFFLVCSSRFSITTISFFCSFCSSFCCCFQLTFFAFTCSVVFTFDPRFSREIFCVPQFNSLACFRASIMERITRGLQKSF